MARGEVRGTRSSRRELPGRPDPKTRFHSLSLHKGLKMWPLILFSICFLRSSSASEFSLSSLQETGIACRLTKAAFVMMNKKTSEVIEAVFKHASLPVLSGERSVLLLGTMMYNFYNMQVINMLIEMSDMKLKEDGALELVINNMSATLKGSLNYRQQLLVFHHEGSMDFEFSFSLDLKVRIKVICENHRVTTDASDCDLTFHKMNLYIHRNDEPDLFKQLYTDFISFTLKSVLKSQICKEIHNMQKLLADFILDKEEDFLGYGNIRINNAITSLPVLNENYVELYQKGLLDYKNLSTYYNPSTFSPLHFSENRMLNVWMSDQVLDSLAKAYYLEKYLEATFTEAELWGNPVHEAESHREIREFYCKHPTLNTTTKMWSITAPSIRVTSEGIVVTSSAAVLINSPYKMELYFETENSVTVQSSYAAKQLNIHRADSDSVVHINVRSSRSVSQSEKHMDQHLQTFVRKVLRPAVSKRMERTLTSLMNCKGLALFEIENPEIIPHNGFLLIQFDFDIPIELLKNFVKQML